MQPEGQTLRADHWFCQLLAGELRFQIIPAGSQFFQPRLCGLGEDTLLDGIEQVVDDGFRFAELAFNGFFTLAVGEIPGVDDSFHSVITSSLFLPIVI